MKRIIGFTVIAILTVFSLITLSGCELSDLFAGGGSGADGANGMREVSGDEITLEHLEVKEGVTYYTSDTLELWCEINGAFLELTDFTMDGARRVYENIYLYEDDYFYMMGRGSDEWYATLSDEADAEYAETEYEDNYEVQLGIKRSGIYNIYFDNEAHKFDLELIGEIETPRYYTVKSAAIYTLRTDWVDMIPPEDGKEEFVIKAFRIEAGENISFYNFVHTSRYKVSLAEGLEGRVATDSGAFIYVNIGGSYDVYLNRTTYEVRLEPADGASAEYCVIHYDGENFNELPALSPDTPHLFAITVAADGEHYIHIPHFYSKSYHEYALTVKESEHLTKIGDSYYVRERGEYKFTVDLKAFELTVEKLPE
ncbi:MAG: hypothetical protein J6L90_06395 [Clostridia bacterium]|nr:hypothetical protein [Clostridia bacterium]